MFGVDPGAAMPGSALRLRQLPVQLLQRGYASFATEFSGQQQRPRTGDRGRVRHPMLERLAADRERIRDRLLALRRVDDVGDLFLLHL